MLGGTRSWERSEPGLLTQTGQRDFPYHIAPCWIMKVRRVHWEGRLLKDWLGISWLVVSDCTLHHLFFYSLFILFFLLLFFPLFLIPCPYLNPWADKLNTSHMSGSFCCGTKSEQMVELCLAAYQVKPQHFFRFESWYLCKTSLTSFIFLSPVCLRCCHFLWVFQQKPILKYTLHDR